MKIRTLLLLMVLVFTFFPAAPAVAEEEEPEITIREAVEMALRVNKKLKSADLEKEQAWEDRTGSQSLLRDNYGEMTPEVEMEINLTHAALLSSELQYQIKSRQKEALEEDVKAQVVEKYTGVLVAGDKVEKEKLLLEKAKWDYGVARAHRDVGMLSPVELTLCSQELQNRKTALVQAEKDLERAYIEFNVLIGLWPERRPQPTTEIPYRPLVVRNILAEINSAVDSSQDLAMAAKYVQLQRLEMRLALENNPLMQGVDDRAKQETVLEVTELEMDEAKEQLKKQVRLFIYDIESLEEAVTAAEEGLKVAEENLRAVQARYDVGFVARDKLLEAETSVSSAKHALEEIKYRHSMLTAAYRNLTGRPIIPASW